MKQQLQLSKNLEIKTSAEKISGETIGGAFCPLPSSKGDTVYKGGAVTSAFMSVFL